jgi:hypothetical protein
MQQKAEVLRGTKRARKDDTNPTIKRGKKEMEMKKEEKKIKRVFYISNSKKEKK